MKAKTYQDVILKCVFDYAYEYSQPRFGSCIRNRAGMLKLERHTRALDGWTRYEPTAWCGGEKLTREESKDFSQALRELALDQLLIFEVDAGGRPSWVKLTPKGLARAKKLTL